MDYTKLADEATLTKLVGALKERNIEGIVVGSKEEALAKIKELIPVGASVMNGSSTTLQEIGFVDYLKAGAHGWNNLHAVVLTEADPAKQAQLRKQAVLSDYYIGSVHALAQTGEAVIGSNSGSKLPHIAYTSPNVILVVGSQKITSTLTEAEARLKAHVIPLEDARMKSVGMGGTALNKLLYFFGEPTYTGRKIRIILVKEKLGF